MLDYKEWPLLCCALCTTSFVDAVQYSGSVDTLECVYQHGYYNIHVYAQGYGRLIYILIALGAHNIMSTFYILIIHAHAHATWLQLRLAS